MDECLCRVSVYRSSLPGLKSPHTLKNMCVSAAGSMCFSKVTGQHSLLIVNAPLEPDHQLLTRMWFTGALTANILLPYMATEADPNTPHLPL